MRIPSIILAVSIASSSLFAQAPVPRKAPEFTVLEPGGKQVLLSSFKGKVVALALILTTCPHCQAEVGILSKLQGELGKQGFQPLAAAINDPDGGLVMGFMQTYHPSFPVGYMPNRQTALDYLHYSDSDQWMVPQIMLIDRKGMIVEQSAVKGTEELQKEDSLRKKIQALLGTPSTMSKKSGH